MERSVAEYIQMCEWDSANFLIFSDNVFGLLVYYSHLLPLAVSLLLSAFIFFKNPKLLSSKWLFATAIVLCTWLFSDLVLWATEKPSLTMFFWSLLVLIEPMIYAGALMFVYTFIDKKDAPFWVKITLFGLLLPTIILTPTNFALVNYDLTNCWREAIEGPLAFYGYTIELLFSIWILVLGVKRFAGTKDSYERNKILLVTIGTVFFLISFAMGNVIGSLLIDWEIGQYGLFGIPVFMAMLSYLIVRYHAFNIKIISTQFLISALWLLTLGILFLRNIESVRVVGFATLIVFTILGYVLIRSVKREVLLREQLEKVNQGQKNLLHIVNHQIKGYLSKGRLIFAGLKDDADYGPMPEQAKPLLDEGFKSMTEGVDFVKNFLDAANINKGSYTYKMESFDFRALVAEVTEKLRGSAEEKGLKFEVSLPEGEHKITGDKEQLSQAVRNLIDNSIRYTPSGSLKVGLEKRGVKLLLKVEDTGVGISEELRPRLFTEGGRGKDSLKININSTGFGLSFVKSVAVAHKGRVWAESEGEGKGSQFYMELPVLK